MNVNNLTRNLFSSAFMMQQEVRRMSKISAALMLVAVLILPGAASFAATNSVDGTQLKAGADQIISGIQTLCIIALPVLVVAGFGTLAFGGISENFKRIAIRIIGFAFVGMIGLFLLAQPLSDLIVGSVGQATGGK